MISSCIRSSIHSNIPHCIPKFTVYSNMIYLVFDSVVRGHPCSLHCSYIPCSYPGVDSLRLCLPCVILALPKKAPPSRLRFDFFFLLMFWYYTIKSTEWDICLPSFTRAPLASVFQSLHGNRNGQGRKLPTILHQAWLFLALPVSVSRDKDEGLDFGRPLLLYGCMTYFINSFDYPNLLLFKSPPT